MFSTYISVPAHITHDRNRPPYFLHSETSLFWIHHAVSISNSTALTSPERPNVLSLMSAGLSPTVSSLEEAAVLREQITAACLGIVRAGNLEHGKTFRVGEHVRDERL
jgi:hypothetical protein